MTSAAIDFRNVSFEFTSGRPVLRDFSARFEAGQITVIIGPSGCGKSTLLNLVAGILQPTGGTIHRHGVLSRAGYVLQSSSLLPWRTVLRNAVLGAELAGILSDSLRQRAAEQLVSYGLGDVLDRYPSRLSGGMRQRVALVRAVVAGANVLLLDEAFSDSDVILRRVLQSDVSNTVANEGLVCVLVTHDLTEAVQVADRVLVLSRSPARVVDEFDVPIPRTDRFRAGSADFGPFTARALNALRAASESDVTDTEARQ